MELLHRTVLVSRRVRAFVVRDFQLAISYRFEFVMRIVSILGVVTTFYFIAGIFTGATKGQFGQWGDPLAAWLTGLAVLNYFMTGFSGLANAIRQEQTQGTLESVLLTPIGLFNVIISSSAWDYVQATFYSSLYLFFGWLFFNVQFRGSFLLALLFLVLTTMVLSCLGILSASFAMVFKRGDPFGIFLGAGSALFSGVFFPREMLGNAVGMISKALPPTYGLDGIRRVLIEGQSFRQASGDFIVLLAFLAVLLPISLYVFGRAVRRAKREGSLIQY
ncbi:MAG: ABC transporter permease [Pyrinomonadaceae bacterium]